MPQPSEEFQFDVFLSHSSKDKEVVRPIAERLRADGMRVWFDEWVLKPGDSIPAKIEEGLESSRVLVLCMSKNAFGSEWPQLEASTFRFRDPLNKERRFVPVRLDDSSISGSLAQSHFISWLSSDRQPEYSRLLEVCRLQKKPEVLRGPAMGGQDFEELARTSDTTRSKKRDSNSENGRSAESRTENLADLRAQPRGCVRMIGGNDGRIFALTLSDDGSAAISGASNGTIRIWNVQSGECIRTLVKHKQAVREIVLSSGGRIYSACEDGNIGVWDFTTGEFIAEFCGHSAAVYGLAVTRDAGVLVSGSRDSNILAWDVRTEKRTKLFHYGNAWVNSVAVLPGGARVIAGTEDGAISWWDLTTGEVKKFLPGHKSWVWSVALSVTSSRVVSGSGDSTVGLWDLKSRRLIKFFEGHRDKVSKVAITEDGRWAVSGSLDQTAVIWDLHAGEMAAVLSGHDGSVESVAISNNGQLVVTGSDDGRIGIWRFDTHVQSSSRGLLSVTYTNAKVLLVGDTNTGKTGLTHRLSEDEWKPSEDSTVGAWSTQLLLKDANTEAGVDREIWLWDFGGQADQRLVHQLYMDHAALILLLFNGDQEDVLPGLRDWQTALRRCVKEKIPYFLVAGRIDTGFKASRSKLQAFAKEQGLAYHETSAKTGEGCEKLRSALIAAIPWGRMEKRTSPRIFKLIKDAILMLRDEGQVLHTFKELRELLWQRLSDEPRFSDGTLKTVINLLDGPGVVKELDYGTYVLLAPEWINAYAQAVIRTLRAADNDLGVLPLRSIAEGKLIYQSIGREGNPVEMKRLKPVEERVVLGEMERQLMERGLCLRQGDKLVFPSHCGRDRPAVPQHPSVFVSYSIKGFLDDIYATLVVKLADSEAFKLDELWRDAADFVTLVENRHMGIKLVRESGSDGSISVYFGKGVTQEDQVIFSNYIHAHLEGTCEAAQRLRHYVCPKCHTPKGNPQVLMEKLLTRKQEATTECDKCENRFSLWDALEKKFASDEVRKQVEGLQAVDVVRLDSRRKGKLLALEVSSRITSADQKCFEIPAAEDEGIDMELEFTDDDGKGTGQRLYLQLKSGNSHLETRKSGAEIFPIREQSWVEYWLKQPDPVMLVIGTFPEADERMMGREKLEFAEVRWMEISSVLRRESANGTKSVKHIEFQGERLDLSSVRRWRDRILSSGGRG